jgi:hypothetical protein
VRLAAVRRRALLLPERHPRDRRTRTSDTQRPTGNGNFSALGTFALIFALLSNRIVFLLCNENETLKIFLFSF